MQFDDLSQKSQKSIAYIMKCYWAKRKTKEIINAEQLTDEFIDQCTIKINGTVNKCNPTDTGYQIGNELLEWFKYPASKAFLHFEFIKLFYRYKVESMKNK